MFDGYGTLGAVALQIIEDYGPVANKRGRVFHRARSHTKYPLGLIIDKVCSRYESVATHSDNHPSYIWWHLHTDEEGEIMPRLDLGKLPKWVREAAPDRRGIYRHRTSWPKEVFENEGAWRVALNCDIRSYGDGPRSALELMLGYGLSFGQRVLTRCVGENYMSGSYECEEWDQRWDSEIIYVEPFSRIDIPLDFDRIGGRRAEFRAWSIAE